MLRKLGILIHLSLNKTLTGCYNDLEDYKAVAELIESNLITIEDNFYVFTNKAFTLINSVELFLKEECDVDLCTPERSEA